MSKAPKHTDDDEIQKKPKKGHAVVSGVLVAMIVGGLGGYGVTNFGGGVTKIGAVGDREISVDDYARALRQQINQISRQFGMQLSPDQLRAFGLDRQVLQSLIARAALDNEAARIGLSAGDDVVKSQLAANSAFQGATGAFDAPTYRMMLQQNGLTESSYESALRGDIARSLLQGAVARGMVPPAPLTDTIFGWAGEKRGFTLLRLTAASLPAALPAPTDAEVKAWYDAHLADYTRPEARRISYAALLPADIAAGQQIPEEELKAAYEAKKDQYVLPEKRLVERLVFGTEDEAKAAKDRLDKGEVTFDALVAERGLALTDIDLGDVSQAQLGAAGAGVFALTAPGVAGPLPSDLGPALYRMNAILPAQETIYEQARPELLKAAQEIAARKDVSARAEAIDDALAGGASMEDLAKEQGMTLASTDYAPGADDNDAITADSAFQSAAAKLAEGDFPEAVVTTDGGIIVMQLVETVPPTPRPLESVKDKVSAAVAADALARALTARADEVLAAVKGGASLASQGITERTAAIGRQGQVKDAPPAVLETVFRLAPDEVQVVTSGGFVALVQLNAILPASEADEDGKALKEAISVNATRALSNDLFDLYTTALTNEAGITLDQAAINAVNSQLGN